MLILLFTSFECDTDTVNGQCMCNQSFMCLDRAPTSHLDRCLEDLLSRALYLAKYPFVQCQILININAQVFDS